MDIKDLITANESLKELSENQIKDIITLGENLMKKAKNERTKEIYDDFDKDIESIGGLKKPSGSKTYDNYRDLLLDLKKEADQSVKFKDEIKTLKTINKELDTTIKEGTGDAALEKKYKDLQSQLEAKELKFQADLKVKEDLISTKDAENLNLRFDTEIAKELSNLKFNATYDEKVRAVYLENAKNKLKDNYVPDTTEDGKTVWRSKKDNEISLNKEKNLSPSTTADLLIPELEPILDKGKQATGTGSSSAKGSNSTSFDISGAATKTQATTMMVDHLKAELSPKGILMGDYEFQSALDKLSQENKEVMEALPME